MATQHIDEGDYGVEIITATKPVAPPKQEEEVKKEAPKTTTQPKAAAAKAPVR